MRKFRKFKDLKLELLKDPKDAKEFLMVAFDSFEEDGDKIALSLALWDVTEALGLDLGGLRDTR